MIRCVHRRINLQNLCDKKEDAACSSGRSEKAWINKITELCSALGPGARETYNPFVLTRISTVSFNHRMAFSRRTTNLSTFSLGMVRPWLGSRVAQLRSSANLSILCSNFRCTVLGRTQSLFCSQGSIVELQIRRAYKHFLNRAYHPRP